MQHRGAESFLHQLCCELPILRWGALHGWWGFSIYDPNSADDTLVDDRSHDDQRRLNDQEGAFLKSGHATSSQRTRVLGKNCCSCSSRGACLGRLFQQVFDKVLVRLDKILLFPPYECSKLASCVDARMAGNNVSIFE